MLDLSEYLKIARKIIKKHGFCRMLDDEDAISYVATYIMKADARYNGKFGTIEGFRFMWGKYAIKNWINRFIKNKKYVNMPEGASENVKSSECVMTNITTNEILEYIDKMPPEKRDIIKMYFFDRMTLREIGDKVGVTGERVRQRIDATLSHIKEKFA